MKSQSVSDDTIPLASTVSAKRVQFVSFKGLLAYGIHWESEQDFTGCLPKPFIPAGSVRGLGEEKQPDGTLLPQSRAIWAGSIFPIGFVRPNHWSRTP
jgi:hypothetical protein